MKLIGISRGNSPEIARTDGAEVWPIAEVGDFWADPHSALERADSAPAVPLQRSDVIEVPPIPLSARVFCIGLNFHEHAAEGGFVVPTHPTVFGRWTASLSVDGRSVSVPRDEAGLDWEVELAVVAGRRVHDADEDECTAAIFGYATFNDLTARRAQKLTSQWTLGKNADDSGPLGPLVTVDESGHPDKGWSLTTHVNGKLAQSGNTRDMIFGPAALLSFLSRTMTINPGDMIVTGTPSGVGYTRTPPWLLSAGDTVTVEVGDLGAVTTPVVAAAQ
ncbi:fumarylacetoacetate hydrolase family protein [Rhodococcus sp. MEB041]|uniref:fumarylacetoacetate hydrolase family protein n=1 Tax=Rhodococcus sp. MEB041 TaxID=3040323 RepID=UPI00254E450C|nr:fumarylacetoacetate hydrolase family protein [Rhodococcus sp. MEB041]